MCGIYGIFSLADGPPPDRSLATPMADSLRHRGPDSHGVLESTRAFLGVDRLRIVDASEKADQPFQDLSGKLWLAGNGEVYNANDLHSRFDSYPFRSNSDIETILPVFLQYGTPGFSHLDGKFAVVLWNDVERRLTLARDRAGENPLFYSTVGNQVIVASEIQALLIHPGVSRSIDGTSLRQFFEFGFIHEPRTIFHDVKRVESGTALSFKFGSTEQNSFWKPNSTATRDTDLSSAARELVSLLRESISRQIETAEPLGVFTSGGVDSSLLVALAAEIRDPATIRTFSVRFPDRSFDESRYSRRVSHLFRTQHLEVTADADGLSRAFESVTRDIAEPIADPAILPTYLLAEAASAKTRVALSGEGADELFGGYPTYLGHLYASDLDRLPPAAVRILARILCALGPSNKKVPLRFLLKRFLASHRTGSWDRHMSWFGLSGTRLLETGPPEGAEKTVQHSREVATITELMISDYAGYLRNNLLVKVDRTTMLHSMEARTPYLDRNLTDFAFSMRDSHKVRGLTTKRILKKAAAEVLPRSIVHRRKRGLSVPVANLVNGALRQRVDRLLSRSHIEGQGLFRPDRVLELLSMCRSGQSDEWRSLWALIAFQAWHERWANGT